MKTLTEKKTQQRTRRHARIRARVVGTKERPRLAVFKSNRFISAQLINDQDGTTLAASHSKGMKSTGVAAAKEVGILVARMAQEKGITKAVFDRGGFLYTGKVSAVAEGAREGGLEF